MLLPVNFVFNALVKHRGKVKAVEKPFVGTVDVVVPEATPEQAPVALRFTTPLGYDRAPDRPVELRRHADRLYIPHFVEVPDRYSEEARAVPPKTGDWLREVARDGYRRSEHSNGIPLGVGVSFERNGVPVPLKDEPNLREVVQSQEAEIAARIAAEAAELLLVDGVLHVPCPEPIYSVTYFEGDRRRGQESYNYLSVELPLQGRRRDPSREYRADELGWIRDNKPWIRLDDTPRIEVLDPSALRADIAQRQLLATVDRIRDWMAERIAGRDVPFFKAYYDLRECLSRDQGLIEAGDCSACGERAEAAHEALHRICEAADAVMASVDDVQKERRNEFENLRDRVAALGVWEALDTAAIPTR